jgi:hypothetical protein
MEANIEFAKRIVELFLLKYSGGIEAVKAKYPDYVAPMKDENMLTLGITILSFYKENSEKFAEEVLLTVEYLKNTLENHILTGEDTGLGIDLQGNTSILLKDLIEAYNSVNNKDYLPCQQAEEILSLYDKEFVKLYLENAVKCYKNGVEEMKNKINGDVGDAELGVAFTYAWQKYFGHKLNSKQFNTVKSSMTILMGMIVANDLDIEKEFGVDLGEYKKEILQKTVGYVCQLLSYGENH